MKQALIVAVGYYDREEGVPELAGVIDEAVGFGAILRHKNYGCYRLRYCIDNYASAMRRRVSTFFSAADEGDELLFYYSGHGWPVGGASLVLTSSDFSMECNIPRGLDSLYLANLILNSKARSISVILDCCHGVRLFCSIDETLESNPGFRLALCEKDRSVQLLCSGDDEGLTYVRGGRSDLTHALIVGIRSGEAGRNKPHVSLRDIASYLETVGLMNKKKPYVQFLCLGRQRSVLISYNPNHGNFLPAELHMLLFSDDQGSVITAIQRLSSHIEQAIPEERNKAVELIELYKYLNPNRTSRVNDLISRFEKNRYDTAGGTRPRPPLLIFYNTRNIPWMTWLYQHLDVFDRAPLCINLEMHKDDASDGIDWAEWLSSGKPAVYILDDELLRRLPARRPDLTEAIGELASENHLKSVFVVWLGRSKSLPPASIFENANIFVLKESGLHNCCLSILKAISEIDHRSLDIADRHEADKGPQFTLTSHAFRSSLHRHTLRLRDRPRNRERDFEGPRREPNFLIVRRLDRYIMVVVDSKASVDSEALQLSYQPAVKATLASLEELHLIGLTPNRIDPMFLDPDRLIDKIMIDADIFLQYLMFPLSEIIIPDYFSADEPTIISSISSFVRAMQEVHGEDRVQFADIKRQKGFRDPILRTLLDQRPFFSRFAPTPDNSLHLGGVRTALISYLFALSGMGGRFHVRFDDTNVDPTIAAANIADILLDLEWLSIKPEATLRETDARPHMDHKDTLSLLEGAGYCRVDEVDGSVHLDPRMVPEKLSFWLDLRTGAHIQHHISVVSGKGKAVDFSLTWPGRSRVKYKFAGAVDDLLHSSIVVRDVTQGQSGFTERQSILMSCIRECITYPRNRRAHIFIKGLRRASNRVNQNVQSPFPFLCPPVYLHVSRVADAKGVKLSKRDLLEEHAIRHLRVHGRYFAESVFIWCLASCGTFLLKSLGMDSIQKLVKSVARVGIDLFLSDIKPMLRPLILAQVDHRDLIRVEGLRRIDHAVLMAMSPIRLHLFVFGRFEQEMACSSQPRVDSPHLRNFTARLFSRRRFFSGAAEIAGVVRIFVRHLLSSGEASSVDTDDLRSNLGSLMLDLVKALTPDQIQSFRRRYLGCVDGPPISVLAFVLGSDCITSALRAERGINE